MKLYIAGKITGNKSYKAEFDNAAKQAEARGFTVLNPAALPPGMTKQEYMRICFAMIDTADAVLMLPNRWGSKGAELEEAYADYIGKELIYAGGASWFDMEEWERTNDRI